MPEIELPGSCRKCARGTRGSEYYLWVKCPWHLCFMPASACCPHFEPHPTVVEPVTVEELVGPLRAYAQRLRALRDPGAKAVEALLARHEASKAV